MKKAIFLVLLSVSMGYSQQVATLVSGTTLNYKSSKSTLEPRLLKTEDFTSSNGRMLVSAITCHLPNEEKVNKVLVSIVCQQKAYDQLGVDKINGMILLASEKIRNAFGLNNGYIPQEIKMAYFPDSK